MKRNAPTPDLDECPVGTVVADRYEVLSHLGKGGMGFVAKAKDRSTGGFVALKFLRKVYAQDAQVLARFKREIAVQADLIHPHITRIFDVGESSSGLPYIVMEFVAGESLATKLEATKPRGLPFTKVQRYLAQIAQGLGHAHEHGVIHRDLTPANILITEKDDVKIADFGVARLRDSAEKLTRTNEIVGTTPYASPEQLLSHPVDARSDIYTLGILGFELTAGHRPFDSDNAYTLVYMHLEEPLPALTDTDSDAPTGYEAFLRKAAAKKPEDRFQSAAEFNAALLHVRSTPTCARIDYRTTIGLTLAFIVIVGAIGIPLVMNLFGNP